MTAQDLKAEERLDDGWEIMRGLSEVKKKRSERMSNAHVDSRHEVGLRNGARRRASGRRPRRVSTLLGLGTTAADEKRRSDGITRARGCRRNGSPRSMFYPQSAMLAGGIAVRLRPITETIPKSLVSVANQPTVAHQLRLARLRGIERVVLLVGHLGNQIRSYAYLDVPFEPLLIARRATGRPAVVALLARVHEKSASGQPGVGWIDYGLLLFDSEAFHSAETADSMSAFPPRSATYREPRNGG
jgi:hypothetical protein